ncbi:unnamed protein product [Durusdinium trenchii]|uniref:Uncharacterized protein n=1 Tax=Durusdinium trenchii TaxID=1381693 RepID=A0ABP0H4W6_9DINO
MERSFLVVTSQRTSCPHCQQPLQQAKPGLAPVSLLPGLCQLATYWCGFAAFRVPRDKQRCTWRKEVDLPDPDHFFLNSRLGLATSWLRRWRYRMFAHRASFQGEGALLRLTNTNVRYHIRHQLRDGWVREILCRRAVEAGAAVSDGLRKSVLNASIETLIATNWAWYEPLMFARRRAQMEAAGDRQDILAIDGNCKLHRRTCGMPFAEVIASPYLNKLLLRGCSAMPHGRDTLCCKHAGDRDRPQQPRAGETSAQESASQSGRCVSPGNPNARPWWLAAGVHSQRGGLGQVLCLPS